MLVVNTTNHNLFRGIIFVSIVGKNTINNDNGDTINFREFHQNDRVDDET